VTRWGDELVDTAEGGGEDGAGRPELFYSSLEEFVREQLAPM
jgi:hypothetical protein